MAMSDDHKTEEAWADFDKLVPAYLDATAKILQEDKHVIPMAMIIAADGQSQFVGLQPEDNEAVPDTASHLKAYRELLRRHPDNALAALLGYDVRISLPGYNDAIVLELEHANGTLLKMIVPYRFAGLFKKKVEMGQAKLTETEGERILSR